MPHRMGLLLVLVCVTVAVQKSKSAGPEDPGYLHVDHTHTAWHSPESLVHDLHSNDDGIRLKALHLLGLGDQESHVEVWSQTQPSRLVGQAVVTPDRVEVSYAALGEDASQEAVVAVGADQAQMMFAAVAVPTALGWERIATCYCWCKYEMYSDRDTLAEFV